MICQRCEDMGADAPCRECRSARAARMMHVSFDSDLRRRLEDPAFAAAFWEAKAHSLARLLTLRGGA